MPLTKLYSTQFFNPAILLIRLWLGIVMLRYSSMYLFGGKVSELANFLESLNWPVPLMMAYTSQITEFIAAILILLGVRLGAIMMAVTMLTAVIFAHHGLDFHRSGDAVQLCTVCCDFESDRYGEACVGSGFP